MRGLEELPYAAGLVARVPGYLRRPLAVAEARAILGARLAGRDEGFLRLIRAAVYEHPISPYRRLLELAGCAYADLERLVRDRGIEGTLEALARDGVYLTVDELKGRRPIARGGEEIGGGTDALRNPLAHRHVPAGSSGSRGRPTHVHFGLPFIRDCAVDTLVNFDVRGGAGWEKAIWETPGAGALFRLLKYGSFGRPVTRWFTPVDPAESRLHPRYRWGPRALRAASVLSGRPLPRPEVALATDPRPVARWLAEVLETGRTPHVLAFASAAVRLAQVALEDGIEVAGAEVTVAGEPVTDARLAAVRRAGIVPTPRYGSIETGPIGWGCLAPSAADDVHVITDNVAVVQAGESIAGIRPDALLVTGLRPTAPFVLLNLSMGDFANLESRSCGCPIEEAGWSVHLSQIRSFEKLTGAGVTFLGTDVIRVLEEVLPSRFGGQPTDYQLVEDEDESGLPRVALVVHPRLGPLPEHDLAEAFMQEVAAGDGGERVMGLMWERQHVLHVERREPATTRSGKFQHLMLVR